MGGGNKFSLSAPAGSSPFGPVPTGSSPFGAQPAAPSPLQAASTAEVTKAIDTALRARGGAYVQYSCKTVSWDDASRSSSAFGGLSCGGSNITDTYLKAKDGTRLFTVRPDNWNEKLRLVSADDVALVTGNTDAAAVAAGAPLQPATLSTVLAGMGKFGAYAGLDPSTNLGKPGSLDREVSLRFQTTFLPVSGSSSRGTFEFATEAFNYNTQDDANPCNVVLLCTTQGLAVQQDGKGAKKLFHHALNVNTVPFVSPFSVASPPPPQPTLPPVSRHWLEAESSDHKVGGAQVETNAEREDALSRGKATASVIGTKAMGTRFNVLMTVQIPLQQQQLMGGGGFSFGCAAPASFGGGGGFGGGGAAFGAQQQQQQQQSYFGQSSSFGFGASSSSSSSSFSAAPAFRCQFAAAAPLKANGTAKAARVSIGSKHDDNWPGLTKRANVVRHPSARATVTVVLYNTVAGGVPSPEDVAAAVEDMEALYASCCPAGGGSGRLASDPAFGVLTNGGALPAPPPPFAEPHPFPAAVAGFSAFPSAPTEPPVPTRLPCPAPFVTNCSALFSGSASVGVAAAPVGSSAEVKALVASIGGEASPRAFHWLHDTVALPWLAGGVAGGRLVDAYHVFLAANALHVAVHGELNAVAHYNLGCCVALACCRDSSQSEPFVLQLLCSLLGNSCMSQLQQAAQHTTQQQRAAMLERGLQAALKWVRLARAGGYADTAHIRTDPDLSALRTRFGNQVILGLL